MWEKQTHYQTSLSRTVFQLLGQLRKRTNFLACCMGSLSDGSVQVLLCNTSSGKYTYGICTTFFLTCFFFQNSFLQIDFSPIFFNIFSPKIVFEIGFPGHYLCTCSILPLDVVLHDVASAPSMLCSHCAQLHDVSSASLCCIARCGFCLSMLYYRC